MKKNLLFLILFFYNFFLFAQQPTSVSVKIELGTNPSCSGSLLQILAEAEPPGNYNYTWNYVQGGSGVVFDENNVVVSGADLTFFRIRPTTDVADRVLQFEVMVNGIRGLSEEIVINKAPNGGFDSEIFLCGRTGIINLFDELEGKPDKGGKWSNVSGVYDTSDTTGGIFTYTIDGGNACPVVSSKVKVLPCGNNDPDLDGIINDVDLDDDNDGIPDVIEDGFCNATSTTKIFVLEEDFGFGTPTRSKFVEGIGLTYNPLLPQDKSNNGEYNVANSNFYRTKVGFDATFIATDLIGDVDANGDFEGRYLAINVKSSAFANAPIFVASNLPVISGVEYDFSMSVASLNNFPDQLNPNLTIEVVDQASGNVIDSVNSGLIPNGTDVWMTFNRQFTPAPGVEIVTIRVINNQIMDGNGNDFGIDNVFLSREQCDFDRDGIPNSVDLDSDNDGIYDIVENGGANLDLDGDGRVDNQLDSGTITTTPNNDSDINVDFLDIDSDNDGIIDNVEGLTLGSFISAIGVDSDFNGVDDSYDTNGTPINPLLADANGDSIPDYLDLNSDEGPLSTNGDCLDDTTEAYDTNQNGVIDAGEKAFIGADVDNDGLDDGFDDVILGRLTGADNGNNLGQTPLSFPDVHNPGGNRDWRQEFEFVSTPFKEVKICEGSMAINLFDELSKQLVPSSLPNTGTWTIPAGGAPLTGGHLGTLNPVTEAARLNYIYKLPSVGSCPVREYELPVIITPSPFAGEDNTGVKICTTDPTFDLFDELKNRASDGKVPDAGGEWTIGTTKTVFGVDDRGSFDPSKDSRGTYTYTVSGAIGCSADTAIITISIGGAFAGEDPLSLVEFCNTNSKTVNLFDLLLPNSAGDKPEKGGEWTLPSGVVFDGNLIPSNSTFVTGNYTYAVNPIDGCSPDSAIVKVKITETPTLQVKNSDKVCDRSVLPVATYDITYSLTGSGIVTSDLGTVDQLNSKVTGIPTGADVTLKVTSDVNSACEFDLKVIAPDCSCPIITEPSNPSNVSICGLGGPFPELTVDLLMGQEGKWFTQSGTLITGTTTTILAGQTKSTFTPSATDLVQGTNTFKVEAVETATTCPSNQIDVILTVDSFVGDVGSDGSLNLCKDDSLISLISGLMGSPTSGGRWTDPNGNAIGIDANVEIDPAVALSGDYRYSITSTNSCPEPTPSVVKVAIQDLPVPTAPIVDPAYCETFTLPALSNTNQQYFTEINGGGTELLAGATITSTQGIFLRETSTNGCSGEALFTVTIEKVQGNTGTSIPGGLQLCRNSGMIPLISGLENSPTTNGIWLNPSGVQVGVDASAEIDTATATEGIYVYSINNTTSCTPITESVTVSINAVPAPTAPIVDPAYCETFTLPVLSNTNQQYFTETNGGGTELLAGEIVTTTQTIFLRETSANGCSGEALFRVTIINELGDVGIDGNLNLCKNSELTSLISGLNGSPTMDGTWQGPSGSVGIIGSDANAQIDPMTAQEGTYTYTISSALPCGSRTSTVEVIIDELPIPNVTTRVTECEMYRLPNLQSNQFYSRVSLATDPTQTSGIPSQQEITVDTQLFVIETNKNGCKGEVALDIFIENFPQFQFVDQNLCTDEKGNLETPFTIEMPLNPSKYNIEWLFNGQIVTGEFENSLEVNEPGEYTINYESVTSSNCRDSKTIKISPILRPTGLSFQTSTNSIKVNVDQGNNLRYSIKSNDFGNSFEIVGQRSNLLTNVPFGSYTVTVFNECDELGISGEVFLLGFPSFFSPNEDGFNDAWNVLGYDKNQIGNLVITVYDRYGKLMAVFTPFEDGWNGKFKNANMPSDDYWYLAEAENGVNYRGNFSLIR